MEVRVLGPLEVCERAAVVRLTRAQERRLLVALVLRRNSTAPADALVEALWFGDRQPDRPDRALRTVVSRLRHRIGATAIDTTATGYRLNLADEDLDAARFEQLFEEARTAGDDARRALALLDQALGLWRGEAFVEFAGEPFVQADAVRLDELRMAAVAARGDARLALGETDTVLAELQTLVGAHPFAERFREQRAIALYQLGRHADALRSLDDYRRLLADELGLEPSPSLRELEVRILNHDLDRPSPPSPSRSGRRVASVVDQLGLPATPLVGRDREVAEVSVTLGEARLVTLLGPGGVGKTRLAAAAVDAARSRFADGHVACSLAHVRDPEAVTAFIATGLDIRPRQHRTLDESLVDAFADKEQVLLLDNCEHVLDAVAPLVLHLLRSCPRLVVLTTSREPLGLIEERLIAVDPLAVPPLGSRGADGPAASLFRQRARSAGVLLDVGDDESVAEICRGLDGLPLALELAAAQLRSIRPGEIAARLRTSAGLPRPRLRDLDERHRSLESVAAWSYDLLDPHEQLLFEGLSVFAGAFDRTAAERVSTAAGMDGSTLPDLLAALVDKSVLSVVRGREQTTYRLLETLRVFARVRLATRGVENAWRRAHANYYLELTELADAGLTGPDEAHWVGRIRDALDNVREARRWSMDNDRDIAVRLVATLSWFRFRTLHVELELWAEDTARAAPEHLCTPMLLGSAALGAWTRGELVRAGRLAAEGIAAASGPQQCLARDALAAIHLVEGRLQESIHHFEHAALLALQGGDRYHHAWCKASQAIVLTYLGRPADASRLMKDAETVAAEMECPSLSSWILYAQGERLVETEPSRAVRLLEEAEAIGRTAGNEFVRTTAGISAITLRLRAGDPRALGRFRELAEHLDRLGNRTQLWVMLRSLVYVLATDARYEPAAVLHAALASSTTAVEPFGPDHRRLAEAARAIAQHCASADVERWTAMGRSMSDDQAIAYALTAIEPRMVTRAGDRR